MKLQTPRGNLAKLTEASLSRKLGGIKGGKVPHNPLTKTNKPRLTNSDTQVVGSVSGPDTMGGVIGGKHDKGSYSGVRAGK